MTHRDDAAPKDPASGRSDDHCYRHPDRTSYVLCQRCARTVCGDCQTQAPVGVICPECMAADRRTAPKVRRSRFGADAPVVTYGLMAVIGVVYLAQFVTQRLGFPILDALGIYTSGYTDLQHGVYEPWRMLTSALLHGSWWHVAMNALTIWIFGRALEPAIGRLRFILLLIASALGGSFAVALLAPNVWVLGASGAAFGLIGAWFVVLRTMRADVTPMIVLIGINVVMAFVNPMISWEAHLGGALVGAASMALMVRDQRRALKSRAAVWGMIAIAVACVVLASVVGALR
ncbi:MAG: rhomboid family intramembrane serine protease [Microbacteriaceae bacterium]|nr:rhomboid family intramembrane serine protease [Microbacteriaceae bacterium]